MSLAIKVIPVNIRAHLVSMVTNVAKCVDAAAE